MKITYSIFRLPLPAHHHQRCSQAHHQCLSRQPLHRLPAPGSGSLTLPAASPPKSLAPPLAPSMDKVDPRAINYPFLGYPRQKGYKCNNPSLHHHFVSIDVVLFESTPYFSNKDGLIFLEVLIAGNNKAKSTYHHSVFLRSEVLSQRRRRRRRKNEYLGQQYS